MGIKGKLITGIVTVAIISTIAYWYMGNKCRRDTHPEILSNINIERSGEKKEKAKTLYIGFIPSHYVPNMIKMFQKLEPYLECELNMPVEVVTRSSYSQIKDALINGEVDVCLLGSYAYILACKEIKITPLVRRIMYGSSFYQSMMIVRKDSEMNNLEDMEGGKIAFTDRESTSGYLLPKIWMKQRGILEPEKYFSEVIFTGNNNAALAVVNNSRVDAAVISSTLWHSEDPEIETKVKNLKIIWQSEAIPLGPFCVSDKLDKELAKKIKHAFLRIGKTEDTREVLTYLKTGGIEGFEEAIDHDYEVIRKASSGLSGVIE